MDIEKATNSSVGTTAPRKPKMLCGSIDKRTLTLKILKCSEQNLGNQKGLKV